MNTLKDDPEIHQAVVSEIKRQREVVELIASENIVSPAVLEAMGTPLTNKYSEGMPFKRYYGGNQFIDISESVGVARAKKLFGAQHANMQPHSGSQANMAAYMAMLPLHEKILAMSLDQGGHLTHGHKVNFSGQMFTFGWYGVDKESEKIDYDAVAQKAAEFKPKLIVAGASAYPRKIEFKRFKMIADEVGALFMVDMAHIAGLIAAKLHPDPVPFADVVTTTTHKTLRGPRGAMILCKEEWAQKIDKAVFPGMQGGPLDHVIAAKAVALLEALQPDFEDYQKQVVRNAQALAEGLRQEGFRLVSGGTDNHLILIDMGVKGVSGKEAETALDEVGICCNKNMIPYDPRKPMDPSGIRIGTPAVTTRGMKEEEMAQIAQWIAQVIAHRNDESVKKKIADDIRTLCARFPIYQDLKI